MKSSSCRPVDIWNVQSLSHLICYVSDDVRRGNISAFLTYFRRYSRSVSIRFESLAWKRLSQEETGGWRKRAIPRSRFRRARRAGHSSILASRADGLSLPLPLWPSFSSSSSSASPSLAKSLYSVSLFLLPFACSFRQLLSLLLPSPPSSRPSNYQHQRRHLRPIPPVLLLPVH